MKPTTLDMELALIDYFSLRVNNIVPNVSWGMFSHEVDLCILSKAGYASEVEIKISKADLIKDASKHHKHDSKKIKYLWFAIPKHLEGEIHHIPDRAGVIIVNYENILYRSERFKFICRVLRKPKMHVNYQWTDSERYNLLRLGNMRVWRLKQKLQKLTMEKNHGTKERTTKKL
jgi:hypothetical protein